MGENNRERLCKSERAYYKRRISSDAGRRGVKANATRLQILTQAPKWVDMDEIEEIYRGRLPGITVDHIVPLVCFDRDTKKYVACGLHVTWNLQYMTKSENSRKNRWLPKHLLDEHGFWTDLK